MAGTAGSKGDLQPAEYSGISLPARQAQAGVEPLFACYRKSCLEAMKNQLEQQRFSIFAACSLLQTIHVPYQELEQFDPEGTAFLNLNTPLDIELLN